MAILNSWISWRAESDGFADARLRKREPALSHLGVVAVAVAARKARRSLEGCILIDVGGGGGGGGECKYSQLRDLDCGSGAKMIFWRWGVRGDFI
jgi:hypothetical protein